MVKLMLTSDAIARLGAILEREGREARIRIRESRLGTCWGKNLRIVLRLGIDELEEDDEDDLESRVGGLPFVINRDLADQHGGRFLVSLDKDRMPVVAALP